MAIAVSCGGGGGGGGGGAANAASTSTSPVSDNFSFTDNGDGTITDNLTGLMWEKKIMRDTRRDRDNLHDADNCHPWKGNCALGLGGTCKTDADCSAGTCGATDCQGGGGMTAWEWVDAVNREGFAGYSDWRLPTVRELQSLVDRKRYSPAADPAFEGSQCGASCTDITKPECSCTYWVPQQGSSAYWSSSTYDIPDTPDAAWIVNFASGFIYENFVFTDFFVRAVRGPR